MRYAVYNVCSGEIGGVYQADTARQAKRKASIGRRRGVDWDDFVDAARTTHEAILCRLGDLIAIVPSETVRRAMSLARGSEKGVSMIVPDDGGWTVSEAWDEASEDCAIPVGPKGLIGWRTVS